MANTQKIINNKTADQLIQNLPQQEWMQVTQLKINGTLGAKDYEFIQFLCTNIRQLKILDLKGVQDEKLAGTLQQWVSLTSVMLPRHIAEVPAQFFTDCSSLLTVELPGTCSSIGDMAFQGCRNLKNIKLPATLNKMGNAVFRGCIELKAVDLPNDLEEIGDFAFQFCQKIKEIYIPCSTKKLGRDVFINTPALEYIDVDEENENFTSQDGILYSQKDGKKDILITFPSANKCKKYYIEAGKQIEMNAFLDCLHLQTFEVAPENEFYSSRNGMLYNKAGNALIRVPSDHPARKITVEDGVIDIMPNAFRFCQNMIEVELPDTVKNMEVTFAACNHLTAITIPPQVKSVMGAFQGCSALQEVKLPQGIEVINGAFCGCTSLKTINIPDSVKEMEGAFWGCSLLSDANIPPKVNKIGQRTFCGCSSLRNIDLPGNLEKIEELAFAGSGLEWAKIPGMQRISDGAFRDCKSLKNVEIGEGTISINREAFFGCSSLEKITLPQSLKRISDGAFVACGSLTEIEFPTNLENIGNGAFTGCKAIKTIKSRANVPPLCMQYAFDGIDSTHCTLEVPMNAVASYREAVTWGSFRNLSGVIF